MQRPSFFLRLAGLSLAVLCEAVGAELRLPAVFSDHMVLQRGQVVPVWGWSAPETEVAVDFLGQTKTTVSDGSGRWRVTLDPLQESSQPNGFTVRTQKERIHLEDVVVGEVWLCSGQSNMAMTVNGDTKWLYVGGIAGAAEVVRNSSNPLLRQFRVEWKTDSRPQEFCPGTWSAASPEATPNFSATGYFFARELQERLKVPVGFLNASFGGTAVESWTSREALKREADPEWVAKMERLLEDYDNHEALLLRYAGEIGSWEKATGREDPKGSEDDGAWVGASSADARWKTEHLPASFSKLGCPEGGVLWLRRELDLPEAYGSAWRLDFPGCKAFYSIYLNGTKIFEATPSNGNSRNGSRPGGGKGVAKAGKNTLTIKLHGYSGQSGIVGGAFNIVPFNPKLETIPLKGEWLCSVEKAFPQAPAHAAPVPQAPVKGALHFMPVPALFNAMLHPLIPYAIRGAAWYQGESNVGKSDYARHLQILVRDWRERWGQGDFPFYLNQLPGYGARKTEPSESAWAECREMQAAVLGLPNTGLANLIDTCEDGDLHPLNKRDAGHRLALVALANTYGFRDLAWSGPVLEGAELRGDRVFLNFAHAEKGLVAKPLPSSVHPNLRKPELPAVPLLLPVPGSPLQGFELCEEAPQPGGGTAPVWHGANARIEGGKVLVWSERVASPVAVRYAWADHPVCNLYNKDGLPAFPFRSRLDAPPPSK